jgi:apolipoprotein N-acyltransferase
LAAGIASGLLLGISAPRSFSAASHVTAWVMFLPLWLAVRPATRAWQFLLAAWLGNMAALLPGTWGIVQSVGHAAPLYLAYTGLQFTLPNLPLIVARRWLGWHRALLLAPAIWVCTEWALRQFDGSVLYAVLAVMQSNGIWWNQIADLFGEWGITFWVALFNVALYFAITADGRLRPWRKIVWRSALAAAAMLLPVVTYSAFRLSAESRRMATAARERRVEVLLVQPDIDLRDSGPVPPAEQIEKITELTDRAVFEKKPDLIVWPEGAVPVPIRSSLPVRSLLTQAVGDWGTPLITGAIDSLVPGNLFRRPRFPTNSAVLMVPGPPDGGAAAVRFGAAHHKRRLVPFLEAVPYSMTFPAARAFAASMGSAGFTRGRDRGILSWRADQGWLRRAAAPICWEALHAGDLATAAAAGAQFFTIISNDDWFGHGATAYAPAAIARLRAIETRRPIARVADTGITAFYDAAGRVVRQAPRNMPAVLRGTLATNDVPTFYVRFPNLFPLLCAAAIAALAIYRTLEVIR